MATSVAKSKPVDLSKTRAKLADIRKGELDIRTKEVTLETLKKAIDKKKLEVACDLWTANHVDGRSQSAIADAVGSTESVVSKWSRVWDYYSAAEARGEILTFPDALHLVVHGHLDRKESKLAQYRTSTKLYLRRAPTTEKARIAAELLEDDEVARAVELALAQREPEPHEGGEVIELPTKPGRRQRAAKAEEVDTSAEAQARLQGELDEESRVYVAPNGNIFNHDYDKENPKSPWIKTPSGSTANWHDAVLCRTTTPDEMITDLEFMIGRLTSPMYTFSAKDKRRIRAILNKALEAMKS